MNKLTTTMLLLAVFFTAACKHSNCPEDYYEFDKNTLKSYHKTYFGGEKEQAEAKNFSIYIDYSDGMQVAFADPNARQFYELFVNSLPISQVSFFEVGKSQINEIENLAKSELYDKIKNRKKFVGNYAPLDLAAEKIVAQNREAVLITDGELFDKRLGERDDPWAREAFTTWLKNGNTIEFFVTDHTDAGKQKHIFYMFFVPKNTTPDAKSITGQFRFYLEKSVEAKSLQYTHFALSKTAYKIVQEYPTAKSGGANQYAEIDPETFVNQGETLGYEFHQYYLTWADMVEFIANAYDEKTGNPIQGGAPLISKLFIEPGALEFFSIEQVEIQTFDVKDDYYRFVKSQYCQNCEKPSFERNEKGEKILDQDNNPILAQTGDPECYDQYGKLIVDTNFQAAKKLPIVKELFTFDHEAFMNNYREQARGEIIIKIHPNFDGSQLSAECGNLHRVDVFLKKVSENTQNPKLQKCIWKGKQVPKNRSIYNSILGALNQANPEGEVIYSFYIKTFANDFFP